MKVEPIAEPDLKKVVFKYRAGKYKERVKSIKQEEPVKEPINKSTKYKSKIIMVAKKAGKKIAKTYTEIGKKVSAGDKESQKYTRKYLIPKSDKKTNAVRTYQYINPALINTLPPVSYIGSFPKKKNSNGYSSKVPRSLGF